MTAIQVSARVNEVAHLAVHFRTDSVQRNLILIVALLDQHDTSGTAMDAGYQAFVSEAPIAVGSRLLAEP